MSVACTSQSPPGIQPRSYESTYWQIFEAVKLQRSSRFRPRQIIEVTKLQTCKCAKVQIDYEETNKVVEVQIIKGYKLSYY